MRGIVGEIKEERFLGGAGFIDELQAVGGPEIRRVPLLREARVIVGDGLAVEEELRPTGARLVETTGGGIEAAVEAAIARGHALFLADVPFACHGGEVTSGFQFFRDGRTALVQASLVAGDVAILHHVADTRLV